MRTLLLIAALSLATVACAGAGGATADRDAAAGEARGHGAGHGAGDDAVASGSPADRADADRTVEVTAVDIAFEPATVEVAAGEVVTFVVRNEGAAEHEFVLGDEDTQQQHEEQMASEHAMGHGDDTNALRLAPGQQGELTWRFDDAGTVLYGCHSPGHYDAGMVGEITVS